MNEVTQTQRQAQNRLHLRRLRHLRRCCECPLVWVCVLVSSAKTPQYSLLRRQPFILGIGKRDLSTQRALVSSAVSVIFILEYKDGKICM